MRLTTNVVQTYAEALGKMIVKLETFEDDRATQASFLLAEASRVLRSQDEPAAPVTVEQPTDEDGNLLPSPTPMALPSPQ